MKYLLILLFSAATLIDSTKLYSQDVKYKPKFFTLHNAKLSMGAGFETGIVPGLMINNSVPANLKVTYKDPRAESNDPPYSSFGFVFDLYSANSILGLLSGVDFTSTNICFKRDDGRTDFLNMGRLEIPLYLKFRPGQRDGRTHLWLLLGGIYNLPLTCQRDQFDQNFSVNYIDDDKNQLASNFSLAGSIGYEFFVGSKKNLRIAFYSRVSYPLTNQLNNKYPDFLQGGQSVLSSYPNFDIREYRIGAGVKFLFRFGEALEVITEAAKESLAN